MNVTFICQGFEESSINLQPWRRIYEISRKIATKGISVTILTDREPAKLEKDKIKVVKTGSLMLAPFFRRKQLSSAILRTVPDVVVLFGTPFSAVYLNQFKSLRKPLIWDIETDIYNFRQISKIPLRALVNPSNNLFHYVATAAFCNYLIKTAAKSSVISRIVVPNEHIKISLCKKGAPQSKIAIIPSAIDFLNVETDSVTNQELRRRLGLNTDYFTVSYFGAPTTLRGPDLAIRSIQKVLPKNQKIKLFIFSRRIVGSPSPEQEYNRIEEEHLRKLITKLKLDQYVEIISGFLEPHRLREYLLASDVVVLPFRIVKSEPPLSIFEAMNMGKTVITTDLGGLPDIIGKDRGILVESGSSNGLANAILSLSRNPRKLGELGRNAQQYATNLPDWNNVAEQFQKILNEVIQAQIGIRHFRE